MEVYLISKNPNRRRRRRTLGVCRNDGRMEIKSPRDKLRMIDPQKNLLLKIPGFSSVSCFLLNPKLFVNGKRRKEEEIDEWLLYAITREREKERERERGSCS